MGSTKKMKRYLSLNMILYMTISFSLNTVHELFKWACQSQTASGGRAKIGKKFKSSNFWSGMKP